ncbi:MAG TPA: VCBS repeat-containing protein [Phycisphaerae bacterium]|nr:VCBS repeat-containing protein [Phycisphaerae bacterium]
MRNAIGSLCLCLAFSLQSVPTRILADDCPPFDYYPPTLDAGAQTSFGGFFDVNYDGTLDIVSQQGVFAFTLDNQGGLAPQRLIDTSLYVEQSFPGYLDSNPGLEMISVAKSYNFNAFILFFRSDGTDELLLEDLLYLGAKDIMGGVCAYLPSAPQSSSPPGQLVYLINENGRCTVYLRSVLSGGFYLAPQSMELEFEAFAPRLVDLNNDGLLDLKLRLHGGEVITMLRTGSSIPDTIDASFYFDNTYEPLLTDYDGDHVPELTFVDGTAFRIFKRSANGYFEWRVHDVGSEFRFLGQGDVDNDGDIDLIIDEHACGTSLGYSGCVRVLRQVGLANFEDGGSMQSANGVAGAAVVDLTGDGLNDIAVFNRSGTTIHIADADGDYPHPRHLELDQSEIEAPGTLTTIDANHDGHDDILVSQYADGTFLVNSNGAGEFTRTASQTAYGPEVVRLADMDEDGLVDVVCITESSNLAGVVIGYGNGDGSLGPFESYSIGQNSLLTDLDIGDINGDEHLDIACTRFGDDRLTILLGNGDRSFQPPVSFDTPDGPANVRVADFNNDGFDDVVTGNYRDGSFSVYLASPPELLDYHYGTWTQFGGGVSADIEVADFDQDGFIDLLAPSRHRGPELHWGAGTGYFPDYDNLDAPSGTDIILLADLNRDGMTDIICHNDENKTISVLTNRGNRVLERTATFAVLSNLDGLCVGDFDGLGDLDIAINDGTGIYFHFADTCNLEFSVAGDTNADGLLTPDDVPGFVAILLDLGGPPGARIVADMNQDGVNDALDIAIFVSCLLNGGC